VSLALSHSRGGVAFYRAILWQVKVQPGTEPSVPWVASADVAELADALDSKSSGREAVWVRPPPSAPNKSAR
jgi:hypothetical protein